MLANLSRFRVYIYALILAVVTISVYYPASRGGFIWDDDYYLTKNPLLTASDGLRRIWFSLDAPSQYFPLVYTTFRVERALWDLDPSGYHWVNILLHIVNALLVWKLLARLRVPGAFLAAMIFALHPVQVESVAWITERKNVLMGLFFLLTLLVWIEFLETRTKRRWYFYALGVGLYMLALSAKTTACTLPAALFLILWLQRKPITWQRVFQIVPFLFLGLAMGLVAVWWERYHQGTRGILFVLGPVERLLVASHAVWFYLSKLLWPSDLTFIYPRWKITAGDPLAYGWILAGLGLGGTIYFVRRFVGRGPEVAALFFIGTLSPLLGFIMLYTFRYTYVADHYQYLASIGPIALVSAGLVIFGDRGQYSRYLMTAACLLIITLLGVLTWRQSATYRDIETLWRTTIARNSGCWMAYNNLGIALVEKGDVDGAIPQYEKSFGLQADYADAHYNLGNALLQKGNIDEALAQCEEALILQPNDADAHIALGNVLLTKGALEQSILHYARALELRPDYADANYSLGNALQQKGELEDAMAHYDKALQVAPDLIEAQLNLGNLLMQKKRERDAIAHYQQALKISPNSEKAQSNLAWALASSSDTSLRNGSKAIDLAERANQSLHGENPFVLHILAATYAESHEFDRAVETAKRAQQLAVAQKESALAEELRRVIELYQTGSSYREP
jgi:tetratricopeptide (TPR) repeat protein